MKKILSAFVCALLLLALFVTAFACEDPGCTADHSSISTSASTGVANDLDQDGDGIPDYMDGLIDIDGDGISDLSPSYQKPSSQMQQKAKQKTNRLTLVFAAAILVVIVVTLVHKYSHKDTTDSDEEEE